MFFVHTQEIIRKKAILSLDQRFFKILCLPNYSVKVAIAGKTLDKKTLGVASKVLDNKGYSYYLKAIEVAEKRFLFYKDILESKYLRDRYLKVLDSEDLTLRIVFAMHGCIVHANKILCHMDNLISDLIPESISAMEVGYNHWAILNIKEPITKCLMTGICICEQGDIVPYVKGCVISDPSRIIISRRERENRFSEYSNVFIARIKKKNNK